MKAKKFPPSMSCRFKEESTKEKENTHFDYFVTISRTWIVTINQ